MWIFSKATRLPQKKKSEFDHLLNPDITNTRLPSKQSSNVCSLLPLRTWIQRASGSIVSVISSWFSWYIYFWADLPCCEKVKAGWGKSSVERNQALAEFSDESQLLASCVKDISWKWMYQLPTDSSQLTYMGQKFTILI